MPCRQPLERGPKRAKILQKPSRYPGAARGLVRRVGAYKSKSAMARMVQWITGLCAQGPSGSRQNLVIRPYEAEHFAGNLFHEVVVRLFR